MLVRQLPAPRVEVQVALAVASLLASEGLEDPGPGEAETQGIVLLEAMAQGTPVLGLFERGTRDVLAGWPGAMAGDCRVENFARQSAELLLDADRRAVLSAGARGAVSSWRCDAMTGRLVELYASLVPQRVRYAHLVGSSRRLWTVLGKARRRILASTTLWVAA